MSQNSAKGAALPVGQATGDLDGYYPSPIVAGIQGVPVDISGFIADGYVLTYSAADGYWYANSLTTLPPGGPASGDLSGTYPSPKVSAIGGNNVNGLQVLTSVQDGYVLTWYNIGGGGIPIYTWTARPATAAVGTLGNNAPVQCDLSQAPVVVNPGEFVAFVAKNIGATSASGAISIVCTIKCY